MRIDIAVGKRKALAASIPGPARAIGAADGALTLLGNLLVGNDATSHPLDEAVSADQKYLYILAGGLSQIVGYRVGHDGSLTQVTTAPAAAGSGGIGAN